VEGLRDGGGVVAVILWSFYSQRGCLEPALPIVAELLRRGHQVIGVTQAPDQDALPWEIEVLGDRFLPRPNGLPEVASGPPTELSQALDGEVATARWHMAEVAHLIEQHRPDLVLVDELRLGAGFAAERLGLPWVSYTHHYFDEADISEAMVHWLCQCFGQPAEAVEVFREWWPHLRQALGLGPEPRGRDQVCWWNQSPLGTLVLGLPELKVHAQPAPDYVHRVGPTLWAPPAVLEPDWLSRLGEDRPAVLVSLSSNPLPDEALAVLGSEAWSGRYDIVATAGARALPDLPAEVISAGDFPHSQLFPRVAAVACSAGYGVVTRAASAGVGVLAAPQVGDQPLVADAVIGSGLGYAVQPDKLTVDWLNDSLDKLLIGDGLHLGALREAAQGYDAARVSVDLIEEVLDF